MTRALSLFPRGVCLFIFIAALAACGVSSSGATGSGGVITPPGSLRMAGLEDLTISVASPLRLAYSGSRLASVPTDTNAKAGATLDYAVYVQEQDGVVTAQAHVLVVSLMDEYRWRFAKETFPRHNEAELGDGTLGGLTWREHELYVKSEGDWISRFLTENGKTVPQVWLARRWSRTYFDKRRIVLEYREPMPSCVQFDRSGASYLTRGRFAVSGPQCDTVLAAFNQRARQAFLVQRPGEASKAGEAQPALFAREPGGAPDMKELVGTANAGGIWERLR